MAQVKNIYSVAVTTEKYSLAAMQRKKILVALRAIRISASLIIIF
jgi:hypothetical protein